MEGILNYTPVDFSSETSENYHAATVYGNLPRDLSLVNRKGFDMTSSKGVPLVYHCRLTVYRPSQDDTDVMLSVAVGGAQSNWVTRNASVKTHFAREKMYRNAGVKKSERGRYDKTLRLNFNAASQTWMVPVLTDGSSTFTASGSDWDPSKIAVGEDADLIPTLFGAVVNEENAINAATFNIQNAYLASRRKPSIDDETDTEDVAVHSILRQMFVVDDADSDEIQAIAHTVGDAPPYDSDSASGTFTSQTTLGLMQIGNLASGQTSMDIDIPFGIFAMQVAKQTLDNATGAMESDPLIRIEVLGISEMQG